ncbi:uncharacterized protein LOC136034138 isoform X2 [Artemia franciscana]|uniref:uncharacterized protein LOC136034138 isoform X2 n=1 Tax=Artemia franciscana TaxID=6661 RepID=UPI0032DAB2AE
MTSVLVHNTAAGTVRAKTKKADKVALKIATALVDGVQCHAGSSCSSQYNSLEEEFSHFEKLITKLGDDSRSGQRCSTASVIYACSLIKANGPQSEANFKSQLDKCFVEIRDACRDSSIDQVARLHLLEVIELRGNKWHQNENIAAYYRERLAKLKMDDPELMTSVPSNLITLQNSQTQGPLASHAPTLMPGEILKNSGKFTAPSKIPGKNYLKDEVVIRNADSGKVPAGAKERLVQITGPGEENIENAKELIADVIRRNASPVRTEGIGHQMRADSSSSVSSSGLDDSLVSGHRSKRASYDHSGMEYRYTVTFGGKSVKIVGKDFEMVQQSKLVLDEYYRMVYAGVDESRSPSPDDEHTDDELGMTSHSRPASNANTVSNPPVVQPKAQPVTQVQELVKYPQPVNYNKSEVALLSPVRIVPKRNRRVYTRQFLLLCAESILSKRKPVDFERFSSEHPDIIKTVSEFFNGIEYLNKAEKGIVLEETDPSGEPLLTELQPV